MGTLWMFLLLGAIAAGCFRLAYKGLSGEGIPISSVKTVRGGAAKVIGIVCAIVGLRFLAWMISGVISMVFGR